MFVSCGILFCALLTHNSLVCLISSVHNAHFHFFLLCFFTNMLYLNLMAQAVIFSTVQYGLPSNNWSHSSGLCSLAVATTTFSSFSSSLVSVERASFGCSGHFSSCYNHSGPVNQSPFSTLSIDAPLLPRSAMFLSVGQYFQEILSFSVTVAIFRTRFATNTFQLFPGFISQ